jgi:hypothetical protein
MSICKICQTGKFFCNSHIIPKFLYAKLHEKNHKILGINGQKLYFLRYKKVYVKNRFVMIVNNTEVNTLKNRFITFG